jgi:phage N-6-adenine-methyltransferase
MMEQPQALEWSESLAQIGAGWWRLNALAFEMGVPESLGLERREWAELYHPYLRIPIPDRREAVAELTEEGYSQREIADALGVDDRTVGRDLAANAAPADDDAPAIAEEPAANAAPEWEEPEPEPEEEPIPEKWQGDKGVLYTTGEDDWLTPQHILEAAESVLGGIDLDPCASLSYIENVPAAVRFTRHDDGLAREWHGRVYMNPPYGRPIGDWTSKLAGEADAGNVSAYVALVPARTDTRWFADFTGCLYCFIRGRLSFGNLDQGAPFPSVAVYYGPNPARFAEVFGAHGLVLGEWST